MNIKECRICHKMIDFDEPWCDHETMEESAWADIKERREKEIQDLRNPEIYVDTVIDRAVLAAALELGLRAAEDFKKLIDSIYLEEKH